MRTSNTPAVLRFRAISLSRSHSESLLPLNSHLLEPFENRLLPRPLPPASDQFVHVRLERDGLEVWIEVSGIEVAKILCIFQRTILTDEF